MITVDEETSLSNLGEGAAVEMFDLELAKVLKNLFDPNKQSKQPRNITLSVKFIPGETQGIIGTQITCQSKLAGQRQFDTTLMIGRNETGRVEARELKKQRPLPLGEVVPIDKNQSE